MSVIPDINKISEDISQIYSDVEAQLLAYSTDITKADPKQIEATIKQINRASLQDENLKQYIGSNGYRTINVGISGKSIKLLERESVESAMNVLSKDIYELVQNANEMDKEEYLKRAAGLQYRFIRIHPFPDSNGRTSRALLNMMTIPKGILVNFSKESKLEYTRASNQTHRVMDDNEYLQAIRGNSEDLTRIETDVELPIYKFIRENCILNTENESQDDKNHITREDAEMIH